jgi:hypothetical protein
MANSFFSITNYSVEESSEFSEEKGNHIFDTTLSDFAVIKERKFRKANRLGSVLKLSNVADTRSIYPMIDEFGYSFRDFFIFKSSWDLEYHLETTRPMYSSTSKVANGPSITSDQI